MLMLCYNGWRTSVQSIKEEYTIRIRLDDDHYAVVDKQDYDSIRSITWRLSSHGYAVTSVDGKTVYMHRHINKTPKGLETDHINGDRLDNRRDNLRSVTQSSNQMNRKGLRGVSVSGLYANGDTKYVASIGVDGKDVFLGYFKDIADAIGARMTAELCIEDLRHA